MTPADRAADDAFAAFLTGLAVKALADRDMEAVTYFWDAADYYVTPSAAVLAGRTALLLKALADNDMEVTR